MTTNFPAVLMVLEGTFPVQRGGGAEKQVLTLGRSLLQQGVAVQVVVPKVADGPQAGREEVDGLDVTRIAYPHLPRLGGAVLLAKLAWLLIVRRRDYEVIHAHIAHNMAAVSVLVGWLLGKRTVVKITGSREMCGGILDPHPGPAARLRKAALRRASLLQATSQRICRLLAAAGFDPARVARLPNGVDLGRFRGLIGDAALRRRLAGQARLLAVFVGRLVPEKGLDLLLEAWAQAFGDTAEARLVLVGAGPLEANLRALAARLQIDGHVVFAGHADDVPCYLAAADIGLLPSVTEGLSNALLEYMACGLPVIGSRVSGTEDFVVPGETGWLFEAGQGGELAACLRAAAAADAARLRSMGENARHRVETLASVEAVTRELLRCYGFASENALALGRLSA